MTYQKQKSPHWDEYDKHTLKDGFPFNEGFPQTPYDMEKARFQVILRSGERTEAIVDYSTQYRAEGLRWLVLTSTSIYNVGNTIDRAVVAAWREL